jgi:hypothetical protein
MVLKRSTHGGMAVSTAPINRVLVDEEDGPRHSRGAALGSYAPI